MKKRSKKNSFLEHLKKNMKYFFLALVILVVFLTAILVQPFFLKSERVSRKELKDYVEEYLSEYRQLIDKNMNLMIFQSDLSNFTFYWHYPNKIEGVISRTHGAGVFFNYSETEIVEIVIKEISEPIEYYLWPEMIKNTTDLPIIRIAEAATYYHLTDQVHNDCALLYVDPGANLRYTGQGKAFNISGSGAIVVFGSLIHEDRMILKGTNSKEVWSKLQARFDALDEFVWDCQGILNDTQIKSIEAEYKLTLLIDKIVSRIESGDYRDNPSLFTEDYKELKAVGASNETLSKILNDYIVMQKMTPSTLIEQISDFCNTYLVPIITAIIAGTIAGIVLIYYEIRIARTKRRAAKKRKKSNWKTQRARNS